jgi:hypothetical protein
MKKPKAVKKRRSPAKKQKALAKKSAPKVTAKKQTLPAKKPKAVARKMPDPVELDSRDSFPASDPPSWVSVTGEGTPDRTGRKRRP